MIVRIFSDRFVWSQDKARMRRQAKSRSFGPVTDTESAVFDEFGRFNDSEHLLVCATAIQQKNENTTKAGSVATVIHSEHLLFFATVVQQRSQCSNSHGL